MLVLGQRNTAISTSAARSAASSASLTTALNSFWYTSFAPSTRLCYHSFPFRLRSSILSLYCAQRGLRASGRFFSSILRKYPSPASENGFLPPDPPYPGTGKVLPIPLPLRPGLLDTSE